MSKKNLAKTAIEGGRTGHSKNLRRNSNKELRAKEHAYLKAVEKDPEVWDEDEYPTRKFVAKEFSDKLNPMFRYLDSQVGRPWDKVRSEIIEKFDSRTTAGRHILYDHLLSQVESNKLDYVRFYNANLSDKESIYREYYIDNNGLLRRKKQVSHKEYVTRHSNYSNQDFISFLNNRVIRFYDGKAFWLKSKCFFIDIRHSILPPYKNTIYFNLSQVPRYCYPGDKFPEAYYQVDIELSKEELKKLYSYPEELRKLAIV